MSNRLYLAARKPGIGARVNSRHPLANGLIAAYLFAEGSGGTRNLVRATDPLALVSGTWAVTQEGLAGVAGSWTGFSNATPSLAIRPAYLKTVLWAGVILGTASNLTDAPPLFAHYYDQTGTSPYNCGSIHRYNDDFGLLFAWNNGTFASNVSTGVLPAYNTPLQIALVLDGTNAIGYLNGAVLFTSSTNVPSVGLPISYSGTSYQTFGVHPSTTVNANAAASMILEWDRPLSAAELAAIRDEPYRLLFPYPSIILVTAPAGGSFTGSGALSIQPPALAASGTYTPLAITGSGDVSVSRPTLAASGTQPVSGTATVLIGPPVLASSGVLTLGISGNAALVIRVPTLTADGWLLVTTVTGSGAVTIAVPTLAGLGLVPVILPVEPLPPPVVVPPPPALMPTSSPMAYALTPSESGGSPALQPSRAPVAPAFERGLR